MNQLVPLLKKLIGLSPDPDATPSGRFSWAAFRKSLRDSLWAALACLLIVLLDYVVNLEVPDSEWAWIWRAAVGTGLLQAVRRLLVDTTVRTIQPGGSEGG